MIFSQRFGSRVLVHVSLPLSVLLLGAAHTAPHRSPYTGQESRAVKSLSESDIDSYTQGRGMGLAKAAELNGYPGPMHVLHMAEELKLTPSQVRKTQRIYDAMHQKAVRLGKQIVAQERRLDGHFARRSVTEKGLQQAVNSVAWSQGQLRLVHMKAHLEMMDVLTPAQIAAYNRQRGYQTH
jgi:Spy/CpxP family protein refolding chaperone